MTVLLFIKTKDLSIIDNSQTMTKKKRKQQVKLFTVLVTNKPRVAYSAGGCPVYQNFSFPNDTCIEKKNKV